MAESHREEIAKLEALYAANPGGRVFVHLAEAYRKAGEHERARRILDEGLARHPDSASGFVVLGRVLADMQISDDAGTAFRRVLELDGGNLVALRWLGDLARQSGRSTEAAMHYRELLIRNPSNEEVRDLVEIVERESDASSAPADAEADALSDWNAVDVAGTPEPGTDADPHSPSDAHAVSPPITEAEDAAVSEPLRPAGGEGDVTPLSAAPGQTGDADEAPVEYGLVELETAPDAGPEAAEDQPAEVASHQDGWQTARSDAEDQGESAPDAGVVDYADARSASAGDTEYGERESGIVESVDDDTNDVLELDELRRDDEAGPVEIHLLDPSFDGSEEDDDEYVTELDLSDLSSAPAFDDEGDYADDSFVADLSAAAQEEPEPDELHVDDVMEAGAALTLLPETGEAEDSAAAGTPDESAVTPGERWDLDEPDRVDLAGVAEPASEAGTPADRDYGAAGIDTDVAGFESAAGMAATDDTADYEPEAAAGTAAEPVFEDAADAVDDSEVESAADVEADPVSWPGAESAGSAAEREAASDEAEWESEAASDEDAGEAGTVSEPGADVETGYPAFGAAESSPAAVASDRSGDARRDDGTLVTETMAVLYRSQGHHERAAEVYRSLLRARPGDERLAAKLRDAEAAAAASPHAGVEAPGGQQADAHDDESGEVWLRGVGTAWTGAGDAAGRDETPYAWTAEPEDGDAGEPIGSYLSDLVGWKAGAGRWSPPAEATDEESHGTDFTDVPDWLDGPGGGYTEWTPDSDPPVQGSPEPTPEPASEGGWAPTADAPVEADAPGQAESQWSQPAELAQPDAGSGELEPEPGSAWSEPIDAGTATDPWGSPGGAEEVTVDPDSMQGGTEDSGMGWTPLDLDNDIPADASLGAAADPGDAVAPPPQDDADQEGSDDDDLEMFRSWLQSLKK